jgi:Domain of unknown function (DUF6883)
MQLPNYQKAVIPIEKIKDYVLNPDHPIGKHKARVFKAALGIAAAHADVFVTILKASLARSPAVRGVPDAHGERWTVYHEIIGLNGQEVVVTTVWIFRPVQPDVPVLVSCYIEPRGAERFADAFGPESA